VTFSFGKADRQVVGTEDGCPELVPGIPLPLPVLAQNGHVTQPWLSDHSSQLALLQG
jgi:hypothetical protein